MNRILLCTDLDRTVLPNGKQPLSEQALELFQKFTGNENVTLVYVSGRNEDLLKEAIDRYSIPIPDYAIGDVGTTIYNPNNNWRRWTDWDDEIAADWNDKTAMQLLPHLEDIDALTLQEPEKQNRHKLSFYCSMDPDIENLKKIIDARLGKADIHASIIWSIDEEKEVGLIDILPRNATKVDAICFLMKKKGFTREHTVFAGDSGNDLPALTSGLNAVVVKNAPPAVKKEAADKMKKRGLDAHLYIARGDFLGMNGNYCAGVLEGVAHFLPKSVLLMTDSGM